MGGIVECVHGIGVEIRPQTAEYGHQPQLALFGPPHQRFDHLLLAEISRDLTDLLAHRRQHRRALFLEVALDFFRRDIGRFFRRSYDLLALAAGPVFRRQEYRQLVLYDARIVTRLYIAITPSITSFHARASRS